MMSYVPRTVMFFCNTPTSKLSYPGGLNPLLPRTSIHSAAAPQPPPTASGYSVTGELPQRASSTPCRLIIQNPA
jgi:hypothetical protein